MKSLFNKAIMNAAKLGATKHYVFERNVTDSVQYVTIVSRADDGRWTWTVLRYEDGTETRFVTDLQDHLWAEGGDVYPTAWVKMHSLLDEGARLTERFGTRMISAGCRTGIVKVKVA